MHRSVRLAFAAGLGAALVGCIAWAAPSPQGPKDEARATTTLARADFDAAGPRGPEGGPHRRGARPFGPPPGHGFGPAEGRFPPPPPLAARLAEQETAIGIRSSQLDAWRDYSDALQATLAPPKRPEGALDRDPFARQRAMADHVEARGQAASRLKSAIEALKAKLTPEQLERVAQAAPLLPHGFGAPKAPPPPPAAPPPGAGELGGGPAQPG